MNTRKENESRSAKRGAVTGMLALALYLLMAGSVFAVDVIDPALLRRSASNMAPQGVYRRNIGFISSDSLNGDSQLVDVDGHTYYYDRGIFWVQRGDRFIVVAAPVSAVVNSLPPKAEKLQGSKNTIYYWFGTFFGEREGYYEVLPPPSGAVVSYIPEGHTRYLLDGDQQESVNIEIYYSYATTCYIPAIVQGMVMYQVNVCPKEGFNSKEEEPAISLPDEIKIVGTCDNSFTLYVNGKEVLHSDNWASPVTTHASLKDGDVLAVVAHDTTYQKGMKKGKNPQNLSGFALVGIEGRHTKLSSTDFFYTLDPEPDWKTDDSLDGYEPADSNFPQLSHVASEELSKSGYSGIKDVWSSEPAETVYFKMIYGEP